MKRQLYLSWHAVAFALLFAAGGRLCAAQPAYAHIKQISRPTESQPKIISLKDALRALKGYYGVDIVFGDRTVDPYTITTDLVDYTLSVEKNLSNVLRPSGLKYKRMKNGSYAIIGEKTDQRAGEPAQSPADQPSNTGSVDRWANESNLVVTASPIPTVRKVTGEVLDEKGEGMPGVSIVIKDKTRGTVTDQNGRFSIETDDEGERLIFSYVGYLTQELELGNSTNLRVILEVDNKLLQEVVVVGYGTQTVKNVTGSIAKIDMSKRENLPTTNLTQALRGTVAGVQFTDSGRPGQGGSIYIRGLRSITASNNPLIILDGIFYNGNVSDINPNDIASLDILKDASAAAIYGSRAANGVILITTKQGKTDKPVIRFNTYVGVQDYSHRLNLLTPGRYIEKTLDFRRQNGQAADPSAIKDYLQTLEAENYAAGRTIDPLDVVTQSAPITSYDLSISGRTARTNYFLSGSMVNEKGLIVGDKANRLSFRANFENTVTDWLKVGVNAMFTKRDQSGNEAGLTNAYFLSPYAQLFFDDAKTDPVPFPQNDGLVGNPLFNVYNSRNLEINQTLFANFYGIVDLPFVKGLAFRLNYSPNLRWGQDYNFTPIYQRNGINNLGSANKKDSRNNDWVLENILTYARDFGHDHALDLTLLYGRNQFYYAESKASSSNFFNDALGWDNLAVGNVQQSSSDARRQQGVSGMARLNYRFKNRYLATFTVRRDGTSVFGENNKYGTFPSAALAWIVSEEGFLKANTAIDLLKLRLSYGLVGNQALDPYSSISRMTTSQYVYGDGSPSSTGIGLSTMANPSLSWETTLATNVALDFQLMKSRIGGTIEYYNLNTRDLLLFRTLPSMIGFPGINTNIGATNNKGLELTLNTANFRRNDLEWTSTLTFSTNRNKITHLYGSDINSDGKEDDDLGNRWFIGHPLGVNYDYVFDGIYQEGDQLPVGYKPGFVRLKDLNGDDRITPNDRTFVGQQQPKYRWSIQNTVRYGPVSLSVLINAMQGWNKDIGPLLDPSADRNFPGRAANFLDAGWWTSENKSNTRPSLIYNNPFTHGFYQSRDFVRVQDVSLSYEFPKALVSRFKVGTLRVYASGRNLLTFTKWGGWDPESGDTGKSGFPMPRTLVGGLNLSF